MRKKNSRICSTFSLVAGFVLLGFIACDTNSSPEGRMTEKLETLQKEMLDSLKHQNRSILDSLGKIRQEIDELKKGNNQ